jgi:hypothetical protein
MAASASARVGRPSALGVAAASDARSLSGTRSSHTSAPGSVETPGRSRATLICTDRMALDEFGLALRSAAV